MKKSIDKLCYLFIIQLFASPAMCQVTTSTYNFEGLTLGTIHGQDNWIVENSHSNVNNGNICPPVQGTGLGPTITATASSGGYVGSQALSCVSAGFGNQHGFASRINDNAWTFPAFSGKEYLIIEFDFFGNYWGKNFFLGYDNNSDNNFSNGCSLTDVNEESFGIGTSANNVRLHDATGTIVATATKPPEWCRYRMFIDVNANGGQGSINVCYRELSNNGNWTSIPSMQNINAGFNVNSTNQDNPYNLNGIGYDQEAGNTGVLDNILIATVNYDVNDTIICDGQSVTIGQSINGASYLWNNGSTTPTITVSQGGSYTVTVTLGDCLEFTQEVNVDVLPQPDAGTDNAISVCNSEDEIDLNNLLSVNSVGDWMEIPPLANQFDVNSGVLTIDSLDAGAYQYAFIVGSQECSSDTALIEVLVNNQPNAGFDSSLSICNGGATQVVLNDLLSPGVTIGGMWEETTGQVQINNGVLSTDGVPMGQYVFNYILNATQPCIADTAELEVDVFEYPSVNFFTVDTLGCAPFESTFINHSTNLLNSICVWDFGNGNSIVSCDTVSVIYDEGNYDVSLTIINEGGCADSLIFSNLVEVYDWPVASFHASSERVYLDNPNVEFSNTSFNYSSSYWSFGDGENSSEISPSHSFPFGESGSYNVVLTVKNQIGCEDSTSIVVETLDRLLFYVPNSFTPDGNGVNELFAPVMTAGFDPNEFLFEIYDRWGKLLFTTNTPNEGWDGVSNGEVVPNGTYTWKMTLKDLYENKLIEHYGHVSIVR